MKRTVWCRECNRNLNGKTWARHQRRIHHLPRAAVRIRAFFATIHIPLGMTTDHRRKLIHV